MIGAASQGAAIIAGLGCAHRGRGVRAEKGQNPSRTGAGVGAPHGRAGPRGFQEPGGRGGDAGGCGATARAGRPQAPSTPGRAGRPPGAAGPWRGRRGPQPEEGGGEGDAVVPDGTRRPGGWGCRAGLHCS